MGQTALTPMAVVGALAAVFYFFWGDSSEDWERFKEEPKRPPPPPPPRDDENISQDDLIRKARGELRMDVIKNYNFALCGPRGTGKNVRIEQCSNI
jgi:hypothetical protein